VTRTDSTITLRADCHFAAAGFVFWWDGKRRTELCANGVVPISARQAFVKAVLF